VNEVRRRLRRARGAAVALLIAAFLSVAVYAWIAAFDPRPWVAFVLAACPLVVLGMPAALMLYATIRRGDPYGYEVRSVTPRE
jgi:cation transport ATPase